MQITLANLHQATAQQVFNQVTKHLLTQNQKSMGLYSESCMYREGNLKCAAGCLIADDEYQCEFEGDNWIALAEEGKVPDTHCGLIRRLQWVHDTKNVEEWRSELGVVADAWNLSKEVLA